MKKPTFPQTPEGVTDWEKVFEDPNQGLITVIRSAQSADGLRNCMMIVIRQLFTRDDDDLQVAQLTRQLDELLAQSDGALPTDAAITMLRQIKEQRQELARAFLAAKGKKKRKKNRRSRGGSTKAKYAIYVLFKNPKYFVSLCVVLLILLGGTITAIIVGGSVPDTETVEYTFNQTSSQAGRPIDSQAPEKAGSQKTTSKPPLDDMPLPEFTEKARMTSIAAVLRQVSLPRSFGIWRRGPTHVMPFIVLKDKDQLSAVCRQLPYILSTLNVELSNAFKNAEAFDEQVLARVGRRVGHALNARLEEPSVMRVHLATPTSTRDHAPGKCGVAPQALAKYLK